MEKLNQDFNDLLLKNKKDTGNSDSVIINSLNKKKKKRKPTSIEYQNNQQTNDVQENKIVIPEPLQNVAYKEIVDTAQQQAQKTYQEFTKQQIIQQAVNIAKTEGTLNVDDELEEKVTETLEQITDKDLTDVNTVEVVSTTVEAIKEVPDVNLTLDDVEIIPSKTKKDKTGYFKTKVNIKKSNIPEIINKISTIVKKETNGLISPRVCDLRVIGNTNKTQLRNKSLKLSAATVVFKPDFTKLKVNKGTRIMLSVPNGNSEKTYNGNLLVYVQESRAKDIVEVSQKDFSNENAYINFLAQLISNYYNSGYSVTINKLHLRGTNNPLFEIIQDIVNTGDYKVKPVQSPDGNIYRFEVISKHEKNQWLRVIVDTVMNGSYKVYGLNELTKDEYTITNGTLSLKMLSENMIYILTKSYERNWEKELKNSGIDEIYYMLHKLKHRKLRLVGNALYSSMQPNDEDNVTHEVFGYPVTDNIEILKTASRRDMIKLQNNDYDAELIIGKTDKLDFFYLMYLAYPIIGGDRRSGREYITRDEYYEKYNVLDRGEYDKRKKTVLEKQGIERNYNSRIYLFQLEYSVNGVKNIYRAKTFKEIMEQTKFLSDNPMMSVNSPI